MSTQNKEILSGLNSSEFTQILNENTLMCLLNLKGKFVYISDPLCSLLGYQEKDLFNKNITLLKPTSVNKHQSKDWWTTIKETHHWHGYVNFLKQNGQERKLMSTVSLMESQENKEAYFLCVFKLLPLPKEVEEFVDNELCFKWFFVNSPIPKALFSLDTFQYIDVNSAWENFIGFNKREVVGQTPENLNIHSYFDPSFTENLKSNEKHTHNLDNGIVFLKSSEKKRVILNYEKIVINGKAFLLEVINDITDRIKYQKKLKSISKKSIEKKDAILKLAGLVGSDLNYVFEEITKLAANTMQTERVSIWEFDSKRKYISCKCAFNSKDEKYFNHIELKSHDYPKYFNSLFKNKIMKVDDVLEDKRTKNFADAYFKPYGIKSTLDVLIQGHYSPYGVLCFERLESTDGWTIEDEEFATSIASIISLAVESDKRKTAEIELIKSNEKLVSLNSELSKLKKELEQQNIYLRKEIDLVFNYEEMVYGSKSFSDVLTEVEHVAATNATVLLLGESGTGKELLARAVHNISPRKNKPLIKVNCAAIPKELIESELFGHKKGSFTGAINDKLGKFQLADGGTLFLDEIGELPLDMQPKLLRAIQESEVEQIGSTKTEKVDIRIIAATNRNLQKEVKEKNFREDLYFRLNVFPIIIPPLRERVEDIPILIEHFVNKFSKQYNKNVKYISEETKRNLQSYNWPGNIRELENLVERAVILSNDEKLVIPNFKSSSKESLISSTILSLDDVQRNHIKKVLKKCNYKIDGPEGAAKLLEMKPSTLRDRIKKLGIERPK